MLPRHGIAWTEEGVKANVEAMVEAGDMGVDTVHTMLMNWTPTTVEDMIKVSRDNRDNGKGAERYTTAIRVAETAPDLAMVLTTEG